MATRPSVRSDRTRLGAAFALLLVVSACGGGGTPGPSAQAPSAAAPSEAVASEPVDTEDVTSPSATEVPQSDSPTSAGASSAYPDNGNGRPASITLVLSGTSDSDGSYAASGPARFCGDAAFAFTGNLRAFNFEFPLDGIPEIEDVTFSAADLVPGSATSVFHIGVSVRTKTGGEPPATVVQPGIADSKDTGSATLAESGGTTTLTVDGSDDIGQTIHLTATCGLR